MKDFLTIATIVKPQGIRGEVKVLALTDSPEDLQAFTRVYVGGKPCKILKVRAQNGNCAFLTLSGIADRNAAELLRGLEITADRNDAPALPQDTFYIADVIGCRVLSGDSEIGVVEEITPAKTDVYAVALNNGKRLVFPAVQGLIESVDLVEKTVRVNAERLGEVAFEE